MIGSFFVPIWTLQTFMMLIGKTWMMEEEWTKVCTTRSIRILFSSFNELCHFRQRRGLSSVVNLYKKKCPQCMLKPSIPVKSGNILRILLVWLNHPPLAFFRFVCCFPNDLFSGFTWFLNQWSQNKLQKITQFRRRTNKQSQPWTILHRPASLELFFFNVFHVLTETPWRKLNSAPVCFGAKDNQFGRFQVELGGSIQAVKLVHLTGQVTCNRHHVNAWSKWGCGPPYSVLVIGVFLTDASNNIVLPMGQSSSYTIPGYDAQSSEIVFSGFPNPLHLSSDKELRLWYAEDLKDLTEIDNNGRSCTDVFAKYL